MSLKAHYNSLHNDAIESIKKDTYVTDQLIDDSLDNRLGITLLARPPIKVKECIQHFLNKVKTIEPNQYYYKNADIHITVMSIISCYDGFQLHNINIQDYIDVINVSLKNINSFKINFEGIAASNSGIMIQGFLEDDTLNNLRDNLRINFKNSNLKESIDKRYTIQTAHSTVIRFKEAFKNKNDFLNEIEAFRDYNFGTFEITNLELVYNDWYQREELVRKLHDFNLKN